MKFLVDAQLPRRLAIALNDLGRDAVHTLDLPKRNATTDGEIVSLADRDDRIVVTKDADFRDGHLLSSRPQRLLHITTGNIANARLVGMVRTIESFGHDGCAQHLGSRRCQAGESNAHPN
ncbi:hypothetical protein BH24ACT5_BH24ACT5_06570 [soil metagenome]